MVGCRSMRFGVGRPQPFSSSEREPIYPISIVGRSLLESSEITRGSVSPVIKRAARSRVKKSSPLRHYEQAISKLGDFHDVNDQPHQPGKHAKELAATDQSHRLIASDNRHGTAIAITEGVTVRPSRQCAICPAQYLPGCIATGARPGNGLPSCKQVAMSPKTITLGWPGKLRSG